MPTVFGIDVWGKVGIEVKDTLTAEHTVLARLQDNGDESECTSDPFWATDIPDAVIETVLTVFEHLADRIEETIEGDVAIPEIVYINPALAMIVGELPRHL